MPSLSVVVITRNEGAQLRTTVENLDDTLPAGAEILVVDDGSTDNSARRLRPRRGRLRVLATERVGVARARNFGAARARGDTLVFVDAHMRFPPRWWQALTGLLENRRLGGVAPGVEGMDGSAPAGFGLTFRDSAMEVNWLSRPERSAPAPVPILPGCCFATRREVLESGGGWDTGLLHRGNVDNEQSVRLWLLGYRLVVVPEVVVGHLFRKRSPYPVGWPEYLHNRLRLAFVHFKPERINRVIAGLAAHPNLGEALALLVAGDARERREQLISRRKRNDDWYFERFGLQW